MIDAELKIWAAGVFDGEGSALISHIREETYQVTVCIASTDPRISSPFMECWGGHYRKSRNLQKYNKNTRGKDYTVLFDTAESVRLLTDIYPYLRARREEARIVLRALLALPEGGHYACRGTPRERLPRGTLSLLKPFYIELQNLRNKNRDR